MLDDVTTAALDELEAIEKKKEDPNFITKQLLRGHICDECWRFCKIRRSLLDEVEYVCGRPWADDDIKEANNINYYIKPLPEDRTCEFYVPRFR